MRRCSVAISPKVIAGLLGSLLLAILTSPLIAQPAETTTAPNILGYDKAHEITLNGTVQEVVTKHVAGTPGGLNVIVKGAEGSTDVHLGPYMTKETQEALKSGTPVQVVGAIERFHGRETLLARQLIFGGRMVTVRNEHGGLVTVHSPNAHRDKKKSDDAEGKGGAR